MPPMSQTPIVQTNDWIEFEYQGRSRLGRVSSMNYQVTPPTCDVVEWESSACETLIPCDTTTLTFPCSSVKICPDEIIASGDGYMYADDADACPDEIITTAQLSDFIVPDHPEDSFRPSDASDSFTHSTHDAVREWNRWNPTQPDAKRFKRFVEGIESRVMRSEEEEAFNQGISIDHQHPQNK